MKEAEDSVIIWISRNEGSSEVDEPTFIGLGRVLSALSRNAISSGFRAFPILFTKLIH